MTARSGTPSSRSTVYHGQGAPHDKPEGRAALHTRSSSVPRIVERTIREHPYEVPCVAAFPMIAGSASYLAWIRTETTDTAP
ncbi:divalent cation tolerance protein CutA [Actinophytocola sp.]|uniref:divalent cation tolerance protein CutA n=1 Tax=Actinophytocola sp. TaxID=1872138 RepID=UPI00345B4CFE